MTAEKSFDYRDRVNYPALDPSLWAARVAACLNLQKPAPDWTPKPMEGKHHEKK